MNAKQKQTAEDFWEEYFYNTTNTPDYHTFIAFCENLTETNGGLTDKLKNYLEQEILTNKSNLSSDGFGFASEIRWKARLVLANEILKNEW